MHAYLPAVGFSAVKSNRAMDCIAEEVVDRYTGKCIFRSEDGRLMAEYSRIFAPNAGVTVCGELDENGDFHPDYAYPYFKGTQVTANEEVMIEEQTGKEAYAGAFDDIRIGITIIFYLTNMGEYRQLSESHLIKNGRHKVILSGLGMEGTILLPMRRTKAMEAIRRQEDMNRTKLMNAARDGDEDAIDNLAMADMDTYAHISDRLVREDILSIVESYLMPCGVECDQYNILGTIRQVSTVKNVVTAERLYEMQVECNDMMFNICINAQDVLGEPEEGRRFKGRIWLQGEVVFGGRRWSE